EFCEGRAVVLLDRRAGYVDREGMTAVQISFLRAGRFSGGLAAVDTGSGEAHKTIAAACETGFIDPNGQFAIPPRFLSTGTFQDGLCITENEKSLSYVDRDGEVVWSAAWVEHLNFDPYHILPPAP
ncbi:MAG: WG repeat-containing protein, partial [Candidatus Acidiferrum sp.]